MTSVLSNVDLARLDRKRVSYSSLESQRYSAVPTLITLRLPVRPSLTSRDHSLWKIDGIESQGLKKSAFRVAQIFVILGGLVGKLGTLTGRCLRQGILTIVGRRAPSLSNTGGGLPSSSALMISASC